MNLCQVVKPMIDGERGVFVGLDLSGPQACAEEHTSSICRDVALDLEFRR
jgi:hypothetical protein